MASFKTILLSFVILFSLAQCKQQVSKPVASGIPQMSKEDGSIITKREISLWEYSKTKQFDRLREIMADDYIGYFVTGNMQPSDMINQLRRSAFTAYNLSNIVVKPVTENVAVIYYNVIQDVTGADGQKWLPQLAASSVYVKRNGTWYSVFYQEMPRL
ncbi:MAG: nuclear transport factor 2 family protein [Ferruginibacter sp.]